MKRYLTVGIIFGILVAVIVTISWFAFPAWRDPASGGFLTLLGATLVGVLAFIQGGVSIWKDLKEEKEKKEQAGNVEQHGETNVHTERISADQVGGIRVTGTNITIVQQEREQPKILQVQQPTLPEGWYIPHPYPMPPNFTGRVAERTTLTEWLNKDTENRLFIIRALGGFGKSALTWHWLTHDIDSTQWTKLVWWSFYEGDASFEHFIEETLKYLKLEVPQGQRPQVDELLKAMQSQRILLIMDGFERALRAYSSMNAAYQGDENAPAAGSSGTDCVNINAEVFLKSICSLPNIKGKVLMTTRLTPRAIKPRGELLQGCREVELTAMQKEDAVEFFHKQKIKGTHAEIEAACAPYGYHPLSLRLLAGRILKDFENPADIAVAQKLKIDGDIIQQKHHVLEVSYDSLPLHEQKLLSTIACFRSPVELNTLQSVAENKDSINPDLHDLVERGLLHFDDKNKKFDLHPIVRRFAYDRLILPERTGVHVILVAYFEAVPKPQKIEKLEELAPVIELYHHMVRAGKLDEAWLLFRDRIWRTLYYQLGGYQTQIELISALLVDGKNNPPRLKEEAYQGHALNELASAYGLSGDPRRAVQKLESVAQLLEKLEMKENLATVMGNVGQFLLVIGSLSAAEANQRHSIDLGQKSLAELTEAVGHLELGRILAYRGAWDDSEQELEKAQNGLDKHGNNTFISSASLYRGLCAVLMSRDLAQSMTNNPKSAIQFAQRALELAEDEARISYPVERDFVRAHWLSAAAYRLDEQFDLAEYYLSEALTRCRGINNVEVEADILLDLARLRYDQKNHEEAKNLADEALTITERCGYVLQRADVNLFLAQYALEQEKDKTKAKEYAETALKLATCDGPPYYYKVAYEEAERMLESLK